MKIIDLLNKIANEEEVPIKFTYKGYLWEYDVKNKMWFYYFGEGKNHRFDRLFYLNNCLNDEVEILEEEKKIPKKVDFNISNFSYKEYELNIMRNNIIANTKVINQIIDYLNYLKSKGDNK